MTSLGASSEITPPELREAESLIGVPLRRTGHNREVTPPAVVRWAKSIGDRNPVYTEGFADPGEHPAAHPGTVKLAPPCWLYSVDDTFLAVKFPGLHALYVGTDWEFTEGVALGDRISSDSRLLSMEEKAGRFCGPMVLQKGETLYRNQDGEQVARAVSSVLRTRRAAAVETGKYRHVVKAPLTVEQTLDIENCYDEEEADGRSWEDVRVGHQLRPIVRGPLTSEEIVQFIAATRPSLGFARFTRHRRRHPSAAFWDEETGSWESWEASLIRDEVAQAFGFPFAHDSGIDRISWVGNLITNWMGDLGSLRRLSVDLLLPNFYGDVTWCRGRVTGLRKDDGLYLADLEVWCENQRGEITAGGSATVDLPSNSVVY